MLINFGGIEEFSTVDYPGKVSIVIFLRGCRNGCTYCHNKELQNGQNYIHMEELLIKIDDVLYNSDNFINAIVISGGEPLDQDFVIIKISKIYRERGYKIGVHTSGKGKTKLHKIIKYCDFVLLSKPEINKYGDV